MTKKRTTYARVQDVLDRFKGFHRKLRDYYQGSVDVSKNERARLLLNYMASHEKRVQECLDQYQARGAASVLNTWLQYVPDSKMQRVFDEAEIREGMSADEVFQVAMQFDAALLFTYEQLAGMSAAPKVGEFFEALLVLERTKESEYARSLLATL